MPAKNQPWTKHYYIQYTHDGNALPRMERKSANLLEQNKHHSCLAEKIPKIKLDPEL
jgi:hypothetical protein